MKTLKDVKETMSANLETSTIVIDNRVLTVSTKFMEAAIVAGLYRQLSMDLAKVDNEAEREKIINRFSRNYLTASEEKKANAPIVEKSGTKRTVNFSQTEIVAEARILTKDKKALEVLDRIALYDADKFGLLLVSISDKPDSLVSRAIVELTKRANEKAEKELQNKMAELDII